VLFWAVTEGPVYVVTGTTFDTFPAGKFRIVKPGGVAKSTIIRPGEKLKPGAGGLPGTVVKPTGFYKVILRPGRGGEPARAVAFLVPHTRSEMKVANYRNFIARVDVVEDATGFRFAVPDSLRGAGGQQWWLDRLAPKNGIYEPAIALSTAPERDGNRSYRSSSGCLLAPESDPYHGRLSEDLGAKRQGDCPRLRTPAALDVDS
jgi:hypothetical protein